MLMTRHGQLSTTSLPLDQLVQSAKTYSLAQSEQSVDLNRVEAKFIVPSHLAAELCRSLSERLLCLSVADKRVLNYRTDYLDTPDFRYFHQHQQKRPRRMKVRVRHYVDTQTCYLEVKKKDKTGLTHKFRRPLRHAEEWQQQEAFLQANGSIGCTELVPSLRVDYQRICFKDLSLGERISFDFGVTFSALYLGAAERRWSLNHIAIVELKVPEHVHQSYGFFCLKNLGCRETSVSKYCVGLAALCPEHVKYNGFKPALLKLGLTASQIGVPYKQPLQQGSLLC